MERPTKADPKAAWVAYVDQLGLPTDGLTKAELVEVAGTDPQPARSGVPHLSASADGGTVEVFSGPTHVLHLTQNPVPDSVTVRDGDRDVPVDVTGSTVRRVGGHFGRGHNRWHVTYTPA